MAAPDDAHQPDGARPNPTSVRVLDAALEMIAERGYDAMSVDALAKRAGVDKSAVYWNYGSKEGLLQAVVDHVTAACIDEVKNELDMGQPPLDVLDQLIALLKERQLTRMSKLRVLLVVLLERSDVDAHARKMLRRYYDDASTALSAGIRAAVPAAQGDVELVSDLMIAMLQGIFLRTLVIGDTAERDRLFDGMRQAVIGLVGSRLAARR